MFPEGTRSSDGELRAFYRGAFWLAARHGVPIVPVVMEGTRDILPKQSLLIRPQPVVIRLLEPIHPEGFGGDDRKLRDHVRAEMGAALAALRSGFAAEAAEAPISTPGVLASSPAHATARAHPAKAGDPRSA